MNILIIGGTGFIGAPITRRLIAQGNRVALFHRGRTKAALPRSAIHIHGDRQRLAEFAPILQSFRPEVVIDTCAYSQRDAELTVATFSGVAQRLVCLSSMDVYRAYGIFRGLEPGPPDPRPFDEKAPLRIARYPYRMAAANPDDLLFNYEKILVEEVIRSDRGLPATVLRLPQVFGPGDPQHRLAGYLRKMDGGEDVLLDEAKAGWRWTRGYVEDIAFAVELVVENNKAAGQTYNVGEQNALTELEWVTKLGAAAGWAGEIKLRSDSGESSPESYDWKQDLVANTDKIRSELGYRETAPLEEALARSIAAERRDASSFKQKQR